MSRKKREKLSSDVAPLPVAPVTQSQAEDRTAEQSGDLQGLSNVANADAESVRELVEEGQFFEAEVVSGVENAPPADAGPVRTRRRREDDVPPEYTDRPPDEPKE
ncbi:MAG TPA: hypothetical protein VMU80_19890 [Bryobacteraceae bacterium]|nr:hypothetical protein [Bryobacteraceae bacterium]